jgi:hypothetical protein
MQCFIAGAGSLAGQGGTDGPGSDDHGSHGAASPTRPRAVRPYRGGSGPISHIQPTGPPRSARAAARPRQGLWTSLLGAPPVAVCPGAEHREVSQLCGPARASPASAANSSSTAPSARALPHRDLPGREPCGRPGQRPVPLRSDPPPGLSAGGPLIAWPDARDGPDDVQRASVLLVWTAVVAVGAASTGTRYSATSMDAGHVARTSTWPPPYGPGLLSSAPFSTTGQRGTGTGWPRGDVDLAALGRG